MNKCTAMLTRASFGNVDILVPTWASVSAAISRSYLGAKFESENFARKTSKHIEDEIDAIWKNKCAKNDRLYNASKFRLAGCEMTQRNLVLRLGLTCYKDLCGTNLSENFPLLQAKGANDFSNKQAYMSDVLGVGLIAVTSDACLVVTRRAQWTGEYPGALDRPGGHPEPNNIFLPDGSLKPDYCHFKPEEAVLQEVWGSARQEAVDELGISEANIGEVSLMGVALNTEAGDRPSLEFFAKLDVSSEHVTETYRLGVQAEAEESCSVHLLRPQTLALLPRLLQPHSFIEGAAGSTDDKDEPEEDIHIQEARWLLQEATPALKGALLLALNTRLLPLSL
ncbi:uridine diphosphate glucose pyrophosphatase NUDT22-like [Portunus trituberculatus]|uniref:uridine diphosphate glucose pyrophosphatase NUDT22-like n=1 Tax=Portunus trituberculatus TaxID=210409 RepID=UPI001E1D131E|nr:uridine diphosphate glucose pyrophosphatase NUDT22-like [Portunus trituberculatus]